MADIINFGVERAKRKSGIKDTALLKDMVAEGYDPCNPADIQTYNDWINFQNIMYDDIDIGHNWTDEALDRLFEDIKNFDPNKPTTYTVEYDINQLISGDDMQFNLDFSQKPPKKT